MRVHVNSLFCAEVVGIGDGTLILLFRRGDDSPIHQHKILSHAWMTIVPDQLQELGRNVLVKYLNKTQQFILYGMATASHGDIRVRWFSEHEARDTNLQFERQMKRQGTWAYYTWDFLTQHSWNKKQIQHEAIRTFLEVLPNE